MAAFDEFTFTVDYDKFIINDFASYRQLLLLFRDLKQGRIPRMVLTGYELVPYLVTKIEEDEICRQQLIDGIEAKLRDYEATNPKARDLAQAVYQFQDQAWFDDHPSLLTLLSVPSSGVFTTDFTDPKVVSSLQKFYRYTVTGQYIDLLKSHKSEILSRQFEDVLQIDIDKMSYNFFAHYIDDIFTAWNSASAAQMSRDSLQLLFDLLTHGEYDTFLLFLNKAIELKNDDVVRDAVESLILHRDFNFFQFVVTNYGTSILVHVSFSSKLKSTSKPIYAVVVATVGMTDHFTVKDLGTPLAMGDFQMFQTMRASLDNQELDNSLFHYAVNSGSPQLYSHVHEIFSRVSFDLEDTVDYCVDENCIDLALFLINHDRDKEKFRELFKKKLSNCQRWRKYMIEVLDL